MNIEFVQTDDVTPIARHKSTAQQDTELSELAIESATGASSDANHPEADCTTTGGRGRSR